MSKQHICADCLQKSAAQLKHKGFGGSWNSARCGYCGSSTTCARIEDFGVPVDFKPIKQIQHLTLIGPADEGTLGDLRIKPASTTQVRNQIIGEAQRVHSELSQREFRIFRVTADFLYNGENHGDFKVELIPTDRAGGHLTVRMDVSPDMNRPYIWSELSCYRAWWGGVPVPKLTVPAQVSMALEGKAT